MYNKHQGGAGGLPIPHRSVGLSARRKAQDDTPLFKKILMSSLIGLLVNALSGVILVSAVCLIAYWSSDPLSLIPPLSLLALLPSNFLGGFISAKKCGDAAMACGCVTAAMWGVLSLIGALCLYSLPSSDWAVWHNILLHAASLSFCLLGAATGGIKRIPSRKKRRFG